ncbi:MAG: hypothetical protein QOG64_716 [Acidimicrobiaceae bacterium]|nr:hypothetical protein [Acidimicrobiaceae bacterium]
MSEARAYLPRVRELVEAVRSAVAVAGHAKGNGHGDAPGPAAPSVEAAMAELAAGDIILRDPERGLIDFHAQGDDGVVYYLCWLVDEPELGWWHLPEEGFAGRKPLPREGGG